MRERQKLACRNGPCMVGPRHTQTLELSNLLLKPLGVHVMRLYQVHIKLIGAAVLMFAFISVSEARWFRGGYAYYYVPASPACYAPTVQPSPTPLPTGGASAASSGTAHQVNRPAAAPEQPLPAPASNINYAPRYRPGATSGGYSVAPRSSWDFGSLPPYR